MTDDWLKNALDDAVADVEPHDALDSILSRTKATPMSSRRPWVYAAGGALLATAATIAVVAVVGGGSDPRSDDPGFAATPTPTTTPTPQSTAPAVDPVTVPVYYLGEVMRHEGEGELVTDIRLFREWASADGSSIESAATGALEVMFAGAKDPDYETWWNPGTEVLSVRHVDGVISVDLTGPVQEANVGAQFAEFSVQQLVYTVQGTLAAMDEPNATDPVQLLIDGEPAGDLWGHVEASGPIARAEQTGTLAPIWILEPRDGVDTGVPVTVSGVAQVFEATVSYRVLKDGMEVDRGFSTASEGAPAFGDFSFRLEGLAAGEYVLEVFEASALDGSPTYMDTKTFVVR